MITLPASSNTWIRFFIITYFEWVIASFTGLWLNDTIISQPNEWDRAALFSSKVCTGLVIVFPAIIAIIIYVKAYQLKQELEESEYSYSDAEVDLMNLPTNFRGEEVLPMANISPHNRNQVTPYGNTGIAPLANGMYPSQGMNLEQAI